MKKTKIICTVGPSVDDVELLAKMMQSGMDLARFDFAEGDYEEQNRRLSLVQSAAEKAGKVIASIADVRKNAKDDILFAARHGMDYVTAASVEKADDVLAIRQLLEQEGLYMGIISKIENLAGTEHIDEILKVSDGIMLARAALDAEILAEDMSVVQKEIIACCNKAGKPVITADQMLESMCHNDHCTRAEASDVANCIYDGTDVIALRCETFSGKYPLEAVETMARIAERAEKAIDYATSSSKLGAVGRAHCTDALSHAVVNVANEIKADVILSITESGYTARTIAKYRPSARVIAVARSSEKVRAMQLYWGVTPILGPYSAETDEMVDLSIKCAQSHGEITDGATIVVTAGTPIGTPGSTNMIKVISVATKLVHGTGIGKKTVTGKVCNAMRVSDYQEKLKKGDVIVCDVLNEEFVPLVSKRASAIVCEKAGFTSTAALVGLKHGLPVIVGADKATALLWDGQQVTVDPISGIVYEGEVNL